MTTNLTIFATYWNEKDWIGASLAQIDALNPKRVFIVDGCFDPHYENRSIDGTREKIETWVRERDNAELITALRLSRPGALWYLFGHGLTWWNWPLRLLLSLYYSRTNQYRLNQAATFTKMLRDSGVQPDDWVMHSDSDQFYPDEVLKNIIKYVNDESCDADILSATELTFFENFSRYTDQYEKRDYNNLPYRIRPHTMIVPTRDVVTEQFPKPIAYGKDLTIKRQSVGMYHHYKFRPYDTERVAAGYQVGDRVAPSAETYKQKSFTGTHPTVIQERFANLLNTK
jgi:hypothetical protein